MPARAMRGLRQGQMNRKAITCMVSSTKNRTMSAGAGVKVRGGGMRSIRVAMRAAVANHPR